MTATLMTSPPALTYAAYLDVLDDNVDGPDDWTITFGFGKPAAGTYTVVTFAPDALAAIAATYFRPEVIADDVVRRVAADLYGTAWAFTYPPEQYDEAVARWQLRRRERVLVTAVEVWG